jgi:hypothetical protein
MPAPYQAKGIEAADVAQQTQVAAGTFCICAASTACLEAVHLPTQHNQRGLRQNTQPAMQDPSKHTLVKQLL